MSAKDLQRIGVLTEVLAGRRSVASAATVLAISDRQVNQLLVRYRDGGGGALIHRARGRTSNNQLEAGVREYALELIRQSYRDFGPTLATEALHERYGITVGRESYGELVQIDGSDHRWFEDRADACTLLVFIDDAASKLMQLRFVPRESTEAYFQALRGYLESHGCPVAFYSDKHSVFRPMQNTKGLQSMTQFGRALCELNIEILCANSSQAKGRVERANRTLQDRLVKELRLAGINDMEAGNAYLPTFLGRFNERFSIPPARREDLHQKLNVSPARLDEILCHREQRYVTEQLTLSYDRKQIILERNDITEGLTGKYVELYDFFDRPMEVRWKGLALPFRVFNKEQRVTHTAVVENKRLGHALAIVKAQQDQKLETKVLTNSEKTGYKKRPRRTYGPDYEQNKSAAAAVEM